MSRKHTALFSKKHGPDAQINETIRDEIKQRGKNEQLPCALAFSIAENLNVSPQDVGLTADLLNYKLSKCQLGLFGYQPEKKRVKSLTHMDNDLKNAIQGKLIDGRLSCKSAWQIAVDCNTNKMTVSDACETLGIKIKPCQLGAF